MSREKNFARGPMSFGGCGRRRMWRPSSTQLEATMSATLLELTMISTATRTARVTATATATVAIPRGQRVAGWVLSAILLSLLGFDAIVKLIPVQAAVKGTAQLGYPASALPVIGVLALICWVL